jgi:hypothetical protein
VWEKALMVTDADALIYLLHVYIALMQLS